MLLGEKPLKKYTKFNVVAMEPIPDYNKKANMLLGDNIIEKNVLKKI